MQQKFMMVNSLTLIIADNIGAYGSTGKLVELQYLFLCNLINLKALFLETV